MRRILQQFAFSLFLILTGVTASASDSDVVICNRAWKIAILGSSTSFGTGASVYDSSWAGKFTAYVERKNPQSEVYNFGIPGYTTYQNLCPTGFVPPANRPSPNNSFNITAALSMRPDALIINMPSNDAANGYSVLEQQQNFIRAVSLADSANVPVWITTTQPRNNMSAAQMQSLNEMREWIRTRFGSKAVDFWSGIANPDGTINSYYIYDPVHVNNFGHEVFYARMKAEKILDSLCARVTQTVVADAGDNQNIFLPIDNVTLNGSASYSTLGGTITNYSWQQVTGANVLLNAANAAVASVSGFEEGRYSFVLRVTDNAGNINRDTISIVVSSRILIDFGPDVTSAPDQNGRYWNIVNTGQQGVILSGAVTTANGQTGIGVEVINRIDGTFNIAGPGTNTGNTAGAVSDYVATATSDFIFAHPSATDGKWRISGLQTTKQYTIKFWGTRSVDDDRIIQIKRADQQTWQEYNSANNTNFNNGASFTFSGKTEMTFDIRVKSGSAFGYISVVDISRTSPLQVSNIPPVATASDVSVPLPSSSGTLDGSASSDDDGVIVSYNWIQTSGPNTASITSPANSITTISNLVEGIYTFRLTVTDDSSAVGTRNVTVTVNARILIDLGPELTSGPDIFGKYWNNVTDGIEGVKLSNAVNSGNVPTGISFEILTRIDGTFNTTGPGTNSNGTTSAVGDYPSSAVSDFAFAHLSVTNGQWKISGLDAGKQYTVKFWGTRTAGDERTIRIKPTTDSIWKEYDARDNADYNRSASFIFTGRATQTFDIQTNDASTFGHISIIDILATNPAIDCSPKISIVSSQVATVCAGTAITFTATATNTGTNPQYTWLRNRVVLTATGNVYTATDINNGDSIRCVIRASTNCIYGVTDTSNILRPRIFPLVTLGAITGPENVCPFIGTNAVYSVAAVSGVTVYTWSVPAGITILNGQGSTSISVLISSNFASSGQLSVVGGSCSNAVPSIKTIVKLEPGIPGLISGPVNACTYLGNNTQATYSIAAVANAVSYLWTVPAGVTIVSGQGSTSLNVRFAATFTTSQISVAAVASCLTSKLSSLMISVASAGAPGAINGPTEVCSLISNGTAATYKIIKVPGALTYIWTAPAGAIITSHPGGLAANDTVITVTFNSLFVSGTALTVRAVGCATSAPSTLALTKSAPVQPQAISGPVEACAYIGTANQATYIIRKVANALSYSWTVPTGVTLVSHPAGTGVNDTIIRVTFNNSFVGGTSIGVQAVSCLSSAVRTLAITRTGPATPATVNVIVVPCRYGTYNPTGGFRVLKVPGCTYTWTAPAGSTIYSIGSATGTHDTVAIYFPALFSSGVVSVKASNSCGTSAASSVTVGSVNPQIVLLNLTGPTNACPFVGTTTNAVYTVRKIYGIASYAWTVPAGVTVTHPAGTAENDTIINVKYNTSFTSGSITVTGNTVCGSTPVRSLSITRLLPAQPGTISATVLNTCPSRRYRYSITMPVNGTSVQWTVPTGGTIESGQGTNTITVAFNTNAISGNVTATAKNNCATSASRTLAVNLSRCTGGRPMYASTAVNDYNSVFLEITAAPNPSSSHFNVFIKGADQNLPAMLIIKDISGKHIETINSFKKSLNIILGENYRPGVYIGEFRQNGQTAVIKLVKL